MYKYIGTVVVFLFILAFSVKIVKADIPPCFHAYPWIGFQDCAFSSPPRVTGNFVEVDSYEFSDGDGSYWYVEMDWGDGNLPDPIGPYPPGIGGGYRYWWHIYGNCGTTYTMRLLAEEGPGGGTDTAFYNITTAPCPPPPPPPPPPESGNIWTNQAGGCTAPCTVTVDYNSSGPSLCRIDKNGSAWSGELSPNCPAGTRVDPSLPVGTYTYSLYSNNTGSLLATASVTVFSEPPPPGACSDGIDIGLRLYQDGIRRVAVYPGGALSSSLRIYKNGIHAVVLVDPADANASKMRLQTTSGVKALCLFP